MDWVCTSQDMNGKDQNLEEEPFRKGACHMRMSRVEPLSSRRLDFISHFYMNIHPLSSSKRVHLPAHSQADRCKLVVS
jgi:hypothetical protein